MPYDIKKYSFDRAKQMGVVIKPSTRGNFKIDVFNKDGDFLVSIGDKRYSDYPHYIESHGIEYAQKRQKAYHLRHYGDNEERGWFASNLLW